MPTAQGGHLRGLWGRMALCPPDYPIVRGLLLTPPPRGLGHPCLTLGEVHKSV